SNAGCCTHSRASYGELFSARCTLEKETAQRLTLLRVDPLPEGSFVSIPVTLQMPDGAFDRLVPGQAGAALKLVVDQSIGERRVAAGLPHEGPIKPSLHTLRPFPEHAPEPEQEHEQCARQEQCRHACPSADLRAVQP